MELEAFLLSKGFSHIKGETERLQVPMIYIFRYSVSLNIQNILGLEVPPDFTLVRNVELVSGGSCVKRINPKIPIEYTMYTFNGETDKIGTIQGIAGQKIKGKIKVIRLHSAQEVLQTLEGVWIHKKYLNQL